MMICQLMFLLVPVIFTVSSIAGAGPFRLPFPRQDGRHSPSSADVGQPLFLTPYIEKGDLQTARKMSVVGKLEGTSVLSYAGFLTVNSTYNSNMYFWLFPSTATEANKRPLLLWLQGGPGGSSLFGAFVENGPFGVDDKFKLYQRKYAWTNAFNMIYIDNPVGTGFSFTDDLMGYAQDETAVGENLYRAMSQIFKLFPEYKSVDFYITGESYAGKYIPALGHRIHSDPAPAFKLKGVAIGDGFTDPLSMLPAYADYMQQIGMLDETQAAYFRKISDVTVDLISKEKYLDAFYMWDSLMGGDTTGGVSFYSNCTGVHNYFNYLRTNEPKEYGYYNTFLSFPEVRKAMHVGNLTYHSGNLVEKFLLNDMLQSTKPWLAELMDNYKVLIYSGQLDVIVAKPLTDAMLKTVQWSGREKYLAAERGIWRTDPFTEVSGYVKNVGDFYQVMVIGGGHILPYDQPHRTYDMLNRFIYGHQFTDK